VTDQHRDREVAPYTAFPWQRPGCADVEELGDDGVSGRFDESAGASCQFRDDIALGTAAMLFIPS